MLPVAHEATPLLLPCFALSPASLLHKDLSGHCCLLQQSTGAWQQLQNQHGASWSTTALLGSGPFDLYIISQQGQALLLR